MAVIPNYLSYALSTVRMGAHLFKVTTGDWLYDGNEKVLRSNEAISTYLSGEV